MKIVVALSDFISSPTFWSAVEALATIFASVIALYYGNRALNNQRRERHYEFIQSYFPDLRKAIIEKYDHNKRVINGELNPLYHYGEIQNFNDYGRLGTVKYIDIDLFRSMIRVMITLNSLIITLNERKQLMIDAIQEKWIQILSDKTVSGGHRGIGEKSLVSSVFENSVHAIFNNDLKAIEKIFEDTMKKRFENNKAYFQVPYPDAVKERFITSIQGVVQKYFEDLDNIKEINESEVKNTIIPRLEEFISNPP